MNLKRSDIYEIHDGLKIRHILLVPELDRPLPAVVANRGNINNIDEVFLNCCGDLAGQGYVVIIPSYRGEVGSEGEPDLGDGDVRDSLAALDYVRQLAVVDPQRIAMWGQSRGGMVALLAAESTTHLQGLILTAPLVSMIDLYNLFAARRDPALALITGRTGGSPEECHDEFRRRSPIYHIDRLTCPVLLMHGEEDAVVPVSTAFKLEKEIRARNTVALEFIVYPGGGHRLALEDTEVGRDARAHIYAFLARNFRKAGRAD